MASREETSGPVTRKRSKIDKKVVKDQEQVQKWLQPVVVIGPNDIVVNPNLGKVKIEQEVKSELIVGDNEISEEVLVVNEEEMDFEEGVLSVKEEEDDDQVQNDQDGGEEIQNDQDGSEKILMNSKQIEKILEGNRLLKSKMKEKETAVEEMKKLLQEKETENETLRKEVQKVTVSSQQKNKKNKTVHKMIADLDVEVLEDEEIQNVERQMVSEAAQVLALFPEVILVIWKKYMYQLISRTDFLNLRFVCAAVKEAIDEITGGPCQALQRQLTVFYDYNLRWFYGKFDPKPGRSEEQKQSNAPPFSLNIVYYNPGEMLKKDRNRLTKLLANVGHSVKELNFYRRNPKKGYHVNYDDTIYDKGIPNENKLQKRFNKCLTLLPNLTKVKIEQFDYRSSRNFMAVGPRTSEPQLDEKLVEFPNLPKLRHLDLPFVYLKEALLANTQVTSLGISEQGFEKWDFRKEFLSYNEDLYELPFLKKLVIRCKHTMKSNGIEKAGILFRSLKFLEICFKYWEHTDFPRMQQLQTLVLEHHYAWGNSCNQEEHILTFVKQFASVENLILKKFVGCNCKENYCTRFSPSRQPLQSSRRRKKIKTKLVNDLWTTLPNLKKVKIIESSEIQNAKTFMFLAETNSG